MICDRLCRVSIMSSEKQEMGKMPRITRKSKSDGATRGSCTPPQTPQRYEEERVEWREEERQVDEEREGGRRGGRGGGRGGRRGRGSFLNKNQVNQLVRRALQKERRRMYAGGYAYQAYVPPAYAAPSPPPPMQYSVLPPPPPTVIQMPPPPPPQPPTPYPYGYGNYWVFTITNRISDWIEQWYST
ncbi:serine/arginine-rich splicing factor RSZ22-like [Solenopsis invicta]|uniref:serine/arginine-rich splicing factor RSZ22-like n=1 Tax=Solenopsis invicta TaxID=13686 RepID=UPI00193CA221|nr:serine/arginine-rich splicing factor RSZ22-like [Solenopsis invicta]